MYILRIFVLYYYIYITIYIILIIRGFLGKWSECLIANLRVSGSNLDLDRTFLDFLYGNSKISSRNLLLDSLNLMIYSYKVFNYKLEKILNDLNFRNTILKLKIIKK